MRLNDSSTTTKDPHQSPRQYLRILLLVLLGVTKIVAPGAAWADEKSFRAYLDEYLFANAEEKAEARRVQQQRRLIWARDRIARATQQIQANPLSGANHLDRAHAYLTAGDATKAKADLRQALQLAPNDPAVLSAAAWELATTTVDSYRDGAQALELAEMACRLTAYQNTRYLGTLAAAQAETGRFDLALSWQRKVAERCSAERCSTCDVHLALFRDRTTLAQYAKAHDVKWFP